MTNADARDHELVAAAGSRPDEAALAALREYDLGAVLGLQPLPAGSAAGRKVITAQGSYVLKVAYRPADVELQARLAGLLSGDGIVQPPVVPTSAGQLVSRAGLFLQEFLPGSIVLQPGSDQIAATMRYVAAFQQAIGELSLAGWQPEPGSVWVRVTDPAFLVSELPGLLARYGLADESADRAVRYLDSCGPDLARLPRQLVHGDIGPDNVLMDGARVVAIIDFTPHLLPVLFAAGTALYWYHVFGRDRPDASELAASVAAMDSVRPWSAGERVLLPAGLVWEALRRLATPLELAREQGTDPDSSTGRRREALRAVMRLLPELQRAAGTNQPSSA